MSFGSSLCTLRAGASFFYSLSCTYLTPKTSCRPKYVPVALLTRTAIYHVLNARTVLYFSTCSYPDPNKASHLRSYRAGMSCYRNYPHSSTLITTLMGSISNALRVGRAT